MIRVIAAFLMCCAVYIAVFVFQTQSIADALLAIGVAVMSVGLWFRQSWSQYLVYAVSLALVVFWFVQMVDLVSLGWPYPERSRSLVSVAILCVPLMFGVGMGVHVFRVFRRKG